MSRIVLSTRDTGNGVIAGNANYKYRILKRDFPVPIRLQEPCDFVEYGVSWGDSGIWVSLGGSAPIIFVLVFATSSAADAIK